MIYFTFTTECVVIRIFQLELLCSTPFDAIRVCKGPLFEKQDAVVSLGVSFPVGTCHQVEVGSRVRSACDTVTVSGQSTSMHLTSASIQGTTVVVDVGYRLILFWLLPISRLRLLMSRTHNSSLAHISLDLPRPLIIRLSFSVRSAERRWIIRNQEDPNWQPPPLDIKL